jgi:hypothetical protein
MVSTLTDDEALAEILALFYYNGSYQVLYESFLIDEFKNRLHHWDVARFVDKLCLLQLIKRVRSNNVIHLKMAPHGMEIMRKHNSYLNYLRFEEAKNKKQERQERFDRNIKNGNIVAVVLISAMTVLLTQCPTSSNKQQIGLDTQLVAKRIDSLKQSLQQMQEKIEKLSIRDTATSK